MAFQSYITYSDYVGLGGNVPEDAFPYLERKAQRQLDYNTFDRIKYLTTIPDEVKEVLTEYINRMYANTTTGGSMAAAAKYSNGVETIEFKENASSQFSNELVQLTIDWLPSYLTTRSVSFDVEKYLQSENNNN